MQEWKMACLIGVFNLAENKGVIMNWYFLTMLYGVWMIIQIFLLVLIVYLIRRKKSIVYGYDYREVPKRKGTKESPNFYESKSDQT